MSPSASICDTIEALQDDPVTGSEPLPSPSRPATTLRSVRPEPPPQQPDSRHWKTERLREKWLLETLSILFSIACVIAMTILSFRLDGSWLSQWTFHLQPSTFFFILITAARSSMMLVVAEMLSQIKWLQLSLTTAQPVADFAAFDSASRGPLGSLTLFCPWKPHSKVLIPMVYAASLITIAGLAMDPFTQQIITVNADNLVPSDSIKSTIAVSNYYNSQPRAQDMQWAVWDNGTILASMLDPRALEADPDVQGSFYNGYYNLGKSFVDFSCPSSNCSWDNFNSLGVSSSCRDVTEQSSINEAGGEYTILTPGGWFFKLLVKDQDWVITNHSTNPEKGLETLSANLLTMAVAQKFSSISGQHWTVNECSVDWSVKEYSNVTVVRPSFIASRLSAHHAHRIIR